MQFVNQKWGHNDGWGWADVFGRTIVYYKSKRESRCYPDSFKFRIDKGFVVEYTEACGIPTRCMKNKCRFALEGGEGVAREPGRAPYSDGSSLAHDKASLVVAIGRH